MPEAAIILDKTLNQVVVQVPGRQFPGIVIQGDTLRALNIWADSSDPFSQKQLKDLLTDLEEHYTRVRTTAGEVE